MSTTEILIEVACALPARQALVSLRVPAGTTAGQAVERSGILQRFPEIDPAGCALGVFGRRVAAELPLQAGDRVEIYRPLPADPRSGRRQKLQRQGGLKPAG